MTTMRNLYRRYPIYGAKHALMPSLPNKAELQAQLNRMLNNTTEHTNE